MKKQQESAFVLSLGGSLIAPDGIDVAYLRSLRRVVLRWVKRGTRFCIITGGGQLNRRYNAWSREIAPVAPIDLDWIGIAATRLHAQIVRAMFSSLAHPEIFDDPKRPPRTTRPILVGGGHVPGSSTDLDAVLIAKAWNVQTVANLTDTPFVYDRDPKRFPGAKPLSEVTWADYRKIIPKKWTPRLSTPFDPIASREAERAGMSVCLIKGHDLRSLERIFSGKGFSGTRIWPGP
jgi:uridylate kinase